MSKKTTIRSLFCRGCGTFVGSVDHSVRIEVYNCGDCPPEAVEASSDASIEVVDRALARQIEAEKDRDVLREVLKRAVDGLSMRLKAVERERDSSEAKLKSLLKAWGDATFPTHSPKCHIYPGCTCGLYAMSAAIQEAKK